MGFKCVCPSSRSALCFFMALIKWKAPIKLAWSVKATAGIWSSAAVLIRSWILEVDCKTEYWEWVCKWTKGAFCNNSSSAWLSVLEGSSFELAKLTNRMEAAFRFTCFNPMPWTGPFKTSLRWLMTSTLFFNASGFKSPCLKSSKKHLVVASTSAVALWTSSNWVSKRPVSYTHLTLPTNREV